jgi:hypothetical protein
MNLVKQAWTWLTNHWVMPTPAELIAEELIQAQRTKLRHQSSMEYHTAIVAYNVARIKRLEGLTAKQETTE